MINDRDLEHLIDADPQDYQRDDPDFDEVKDFSEYGDNAGTIVNTILEKD